MNLLINSLQNCKTSYLSLLKIYTFYDHSHALYWLVELRIALDSRTWWNILTFHPYGLMVLLHENFDFPHTQTIFFSNSKIGLKSTMYIFIYRPEKLSNCIFLLNQTRINVGKRFRYFPFFVSRSIFYILFFFGSEKEKNNL